MSLIPRLSDDAILALLNALEPGQVLPDPHRIDLHYTVRELNASHVVVQASTSKQRCFSIHKKDVMMAYRKRLWQKDNKVGMHIYMAALAYYVSMAQHSQI